VLLSGILAEPMALYDAIEAGGGLVVADDTAVLGRRLRAPGQGSGAFARMASHLLSGPPDPTLGAPLQARIEHLTSLAARSGARAVIFTLVRACEPELFDLPALLRALEARGLRALVLETDLEAPRGRRGAQELPSQVLTRVEALLESLS
jgi:benzoyl-CoA reductase/2-hydroxyglutaryl-CoA dehydratase subunit BcrC/BadD/HgdB